LLQPGYKFKIFAVKEKWFDFFGKYLVSKAFWLSAG
jgi:hypothetical protein